MLTGADPAFCAGLDLGELSSTGINSGSGGGSENAPARSGARGPFPRLTKPLIGAINGVAVTGGFELALNCDFLIASEHAKFGDTHTRVGVMPGWGLTVLLPQAIGVRRAREMSFTGNFMSADEALERGLVNHVVPHPRTDPVHPIHRRRHREQRVRGRPPDPPDVRRDRPRRRRLGDRGPRLACLAALDVEPRDDRRPPRHDPGSRPNAVATQIVRAAGAEVGFDRFGDVEGEDLGAGLVEVEAVVGADVLALPSRGSITYSAQPPCDQRTGSRCR